MQDRRIKTGRSGQVDAGQANSGQEDSGQADAGQMDSGQADSGQVDVTAAVQAQFHSIQKQPWRQRSPSRDQSEQTQSSRRILDEDSFRYWTQRGKEKSFTRQTDK